MFSRCVLLLVVCSGCGVSNKSYVDIALQPYFSSFEIDVGADASNITAVIGTLPAPTVGLCQINGDTRTITVDKTYWDAASFDARQQTIYHELGHCALLLGHTSDLLPDLCPASIMFPYTFGASECYKGNKQYYFNQEGHK